MSGSGICDVRAAVLSICAAAIFSAGFGALPQSFIDSTDAIIDTLRKGDCILTINGGSQPAAGRVIIVEQLRNHFGFGASIGKKWFTETDSANYGDAFRRYFEWATPENEMKWNVNEELDDWQDYDAADWLINWCDLHNIEVRGHNLFWNEHDGWIPDWTKELDQESFKAAMKRRIDSAMEHFRGRVAHWDLINEIVHGPEGNVVRPGMLATMSGDTNVFSWIFKEARAIDSNVVMAVNEYNVVEQTSAAKEYINEIKDIELDGGRIDMVGLEGHFSTYVERSSYLDRIDTMAGAITQPIWLTEVDFEIDTLLRADKMEELMRTCFAHPRVGGLVLWVWWEGNRWRPYTSFLVDSNYTENELGARWRTVRSGWRSATSGNVGNDATFSFRGFYGQYRVKVYMDDVVYSDTIDFAPGLTKDPVAVTVNLDSPVDAKTGRIAAARPIKMRLDGAQIDLAVLPCEMDRLHLSTYSLGGRLLDRRPLMIRDGRVTTVAPLPAGCNVVRICAGNRTLHTARSVNLR